MATREIWMRFGRQVKQPTLPHQARQPCLHVVSGLLTPLAGTEQPRACSSSTPGWIFSSSFSKARARIMCSSMRKDTAFLMSHSSRRGCGSLSLCASACHPGFRVVVLLCPCCPPFPFLPSLQLWDSGPNTRHRGNSLI